VSATREEWKEHAAMCTMVAICFSRQAIPGGRSSFGVKFFVVKWLMCVRCKCGAKDTLMGSCVAMERVVHHTHGQTPSFGAI
jgi:hypothetical protein